MTTAPGIITEAQKQQIQSLLWQSHSDAYFEDCLKIKDKISLEKIPFRLRKNQKKIQDVINSQIRMGRPVRVLILKYRQGGISTLSAGNVFRGVRFNKRAAAMVVSLDADSAEHIYSMYQFFYENLPESEKTQLPTVAANRKEVKFGPVHGGKILVETAGKTSAGHSYTLHYLHLSEVSRWPEGTDDARAGLLNSVPDSPNTMIIVESVANGQQGWFWKEWNKVHSSYARIFIPWFDQEEYCSDLPMKEGDYIGTLELEEIELLERYKLSLEQIEWRRLTIRDKCDGSSDKFREQYPSNPREAFLSSGASYFDSKVLDSIVTTAATRGNLEIEENQFTKKREIRFNLHERGFLRMFKKPQPAGCYVIGADVAEGIEVEGAPQDDKHDYSSADVLDRRTGEQVAHWHGRITPDEFGIQLALLGEYFNYAFIGVESNAGYGTHVLEVLTNREHYPSHLIYRQQVLDELTKRTTTKLGWRTTNANKRSLISALDRSIRQKEILLQSEETMGEMYSFVKKPNGRIEGGSGAHDDRVISVAISNMMLAAAPPMELLQGNPMGVQMRPFSYKPMRMST